MTLKVNSICIVGGGSAGWMSATTMIRRFPDLKVTLIESPDIATIGVGESTVGGITNWMNMCGIQNEEFMVDTDSTYKLSIAFKDFYLPDSGTFFYPFGEGVPQTDDQFVGHPSHAWYIKRLVEPDTPVSDYAECMNSQMALVMQNKFSRNERGLFPLYFYPADVAYQFDATKFGLWLRDNICLPEGLEHIKETIDKENFKVNEDGIESITLDSGKKIEADLFIDCTGFRSLLLEDVMGVEFESIEDMIPNNKAWATRIPYTNPREQMWPYTLCTAVENGWIWEIPLYSRLGSGYVYSDRFISDDDALVQFQQNLIKKGYKSPEKLDYKHIKMRNGIHKKLWVKNVVAVGLSSGFIEPLESNGLWTTHENLTELARTLERNFMVNSWDREQFNGKMLLTFATFAEFVALHYMWSHRSDTEYWKEISERNWLEIQNPNQPVGKTKNLDIFGLAPIGRSFFDKTSGFGWNTEEKASGIPYIATGLHNFPIDRAKIESLWISKHFGDQTLDARGRFISYYKNHISELNTRRDRWRKLAGSCQNHYEYLKEHVYNEA